METITNATVIIPIASIYGTMPSEIEAVCTLVRLRKDSIALVTTPLLHPSLRQALQQAGRRGALASSADRDGGGQRRRIAVTSKGTSGARSGLASTGAPRRPRRQACRLRRRCATRGR